MELNFENKTVSAYRETARLTKTVQTAAECVVPDTSDDIGRISSVQTGILLKSKEVTAHGVTVEGEVSASVIYITDDENSVSYVSMTKEFTIEYDVQNMSDEAKAQIRLYTANVQAKAVNPRKVSVIFEVAGELEIFSPDVFAVETIIPEKDTTEGIHVRAESVDYTVTTAVTEKTFALSEQFTFPSAKPKPAKIISEKCDFRINDTQTVGAKAIVRGQLTVLLCYLSDEVNYPVWTEFKSPFSQIIETGDENISCCASNVQTTAAYFDIQDAINDEKALNVEVHALLQLRCCRGIKSSYLADVYSNLLPSKCKVEKTLYTSASEIQQIKLIGDERFAVSDDCEDVLSILPTVSRPTINAEKLMSSVVLDIIYRSKGGTLASIKRQINMESELRETSCRIQNAVLSDIYMRPEKDQLEAHAEISVGTLSEKRLERSRVVAVELDEEAPYDYDSFPTLTLVRAETEDLWEYARNYHSSVERILSCNETESGFRGKLLMIPKTV